MRANLLWAILIGAVLGLTACFGSGKKNGERSGGFSTQNNAPTITGSPPSSILQGQAYEYTPTASDADGDTLNFTVTRKPAWASFDRATGRLSGTPNSAAVGSYTNIGISVSDGRATAALANFSITVNQIGEGSATLSWTPPTANADGSTLTNLAGYHIYYGANRNVLNRSVALNNPGLTRYAVENLPRARWYFAMTSVNSRGVESRRSALVSKAIS